MQALSLLCDISGAAGCRRAQAADGAISMRKTSAPVLAYDWTGIYIGGHVGAGFSYRDWTLIDGAHIGSRRCRHVRRSARIQLSNREMGGGQKATVLGQPEGREPVPGREQYLLDQADLAGHGHGPDRLCVRSGAVLCQRRRCLHACRIFQDGQVPSHARRERGGRRNGWTVGAGMEYALWRSWTLKLEYDYLDFGSRALRDDQHRDRGICRRMSCCGRRRTR